MVTKLSIVFRAKRLTDFVTIKSILPDIHHDFPFVIGRQCTFIHGDTNKLDFPYESFDAVISNYVYHYITGAGKHALLPEGLRVPKKGIIIKHKTPPQNCSAAGFDYVLKRPKRLISSGFRA